jgi:uncharacterized protein (DUF1697 family)
MAGNRLAVFVRAINTTGRRLTNADLLRPVHELGLEASAYQAAGNIVITSEQDPLQLEGDLTAALSQAYGFPAPVFVRTFDHLRDCVTHLPFGADVIAQTEGRTQITFLADTPDGDRIADALALVPPEDTVAFIGREWFWLPRAGISDSRLPVTRVERIVGAMTMRTVGTVERMVARYSDAH